MDNCPLFHGACYFPLFFAFCAVSIRADAKATILNVRPLLKKHFSLRCQRKTLAKRKATKGMFPFGNSLVQDYKFKFYIRSVIVTAGLPRCYIGSSRFVSRTHIFTAVSLPDLHNRSCYRGGSVSIMRKLSDTVPSSPVRSRGWQFFLAEALIGISRKLFLVPEGGYGFSLVLRLAPACSKGKTLGHFLLELFFVDTKKSGKVSPSLYIIHYLS